MTRFFPSIGSSEVAKYAVVDSNIFGREIPVTNCAAIVGSVATIMNLALYCPEVVTTFPLVTNSTRSFNFRFATRAAKAWENWPTPPAGMPGRDLTKLRKISCATAAAIFFGSLRNTPVKNGFKTRSYSVGNEVV